MAAPTLWTYADAVERVLDRFSQKGTALEYRRAREAVLMAYAELPGKKLGGWSYFKRRLQVVTEASYSTGTVVYTASSRTFTLTGGTFPANAIYGNIRVNDVSYPIQSRTSGTAVVIRAQGAPAADITSTTFEWYRESYPFPCNWWRMDELVDISDSRGLKYKSPSAALQLQHSYSNQTINRPEWYTIRNDDRFANSVSLILGPPPNTVRTYEAAEYQGGRPLEVFEYATGTAAITADTTTVTGTSTVWNATTHLGAVIRLDTSTTAPTSPFGNIDGTYNPAAYTRRVVAVASTTSLTLDVAIPETLSGVAYTMSDMIDIEYTSMLNLFWAMCDSKMAELIRNKEIKRFLMNEQMALDWANTYDERDTSVGTGEQQQVSGTNGGLAIGSTWEPS